MCVCVFEHVWAYIYGFGIDFLSMAFHCDQPQQPQKPERISKKQSKNQNVESDNSQSGKTEVAP
jgi:hypothetical protein